MRGWQLLTWMVASVAAAGGRVDAVAAPERFARIVVPVTDLRREPVGATVELPQDPLQESQLLYGELVRVLDEHEGWARVEALEQLEWTHRRVWEGYPGWIAAAHLRPAPDPWLPNVVVTEPVAPLRTAPDPAAPVRVTCALGTELVASSIGDTWCQTTLLDGSTAWIARQAVEPLAALAAKPEAEVRAHLVRTATRLLGLPYHWGGRSTLSEAAADRSPMIAALDCSGLTNLCYRATGWRIPRDAHEQSLAARPITRSELQPGDLIFLSDPLDHTTVVHVMLYAGEGAVIEAPRTGFAVRRITLEQRLGRPLDQLESGDQVDGQHVLFGRILP